MEKVQPEHESLVEYSYDVSLVHAGPLSRSYSALLSFAIQQRFYAFTQSRPGDVEHYLCTRIFPSVTTLLDTPRIPHVLSSLSPTCQFSQNNTQFYQAAGVCPPLAGLFVDQSILQTKLKDMIIADTQKNVILVDEQYRILFICISSAAVTELKGLLQLIHDDADKLHIQNHRYSAERLMTKNTVMYCHGTRMTMEANSYGSYEHPPEYTQTQENQIQCFVQLVWKIVNANCATLFPSHDTPVYYTGTPFSKFSYSYNSNRSFHCDSNNWGYTVGFATSLNGTEPLVVFILSSRNICFPIPPTGMIMIWNANEEHATHLFDTNSQTNIFAGCAIFQTKSAIYHLKKKK